MTIVSRMKLNHPALGTAGGASLHSAIEAIYQKIGDMSTSRWFAQANLNNGSSVDFEHNFVCNQFTDLRFDLYLYNTGTGEMTIVPSPRTGWTIIATPGQEKTHIRVTNGTGSAKDIALIVEQDPIELDELTDVVLTSPSANEILKYNGTNWVNSAPEGLGFVPLGAIIPIASNLTGANAIPPTGTVVNGWQYCDGAIIPGGNTVSGTTPNLTDSRFLMGFSSAGAVAGSNTHTHSVTTNVAVGAHTALALNTEASHTHTISHTHGTNSQLGSITLAHSHTVNSHDHTIGHTHGTDSQLGTITLAHGHTVDSHTHSMYHVHQWQLTYYLNGTPTFARYSLDGSDTSRTQIDSTDREFDRLIYAFSTGGSAGGLVIDPTPTGMSPGGLKRFYTTGVIGAPSGSGNSAVTGGTSPGTSSQLSNYGASHAHTTNSQSTSTSGTSTPGTSSGLTNYDATHTHSTNSQSTASSGVGDAHTHTFSTNISAHSVTNNAVTSDSGSTLPKYLTVQYLIRVK